MEAECRGRFTKALAGTASKKKRSTKMNAQPKKARLKSAHQGSRSLEVCTLPPNLSGEVKNEQGANVPARLNSKCSHADSTWESPVRRKVCGEFVSKDYARRKSHSFWMQMSFRGERW